MALFQPTNIIPSSLIGQGTVDVNNTMEISWQVNGNSAMTAFQIDFYQNDTASTYVTTTGKLPASGETQAQYGLPFYGTDRFGNPQFFTYSPSNQTWASKGFTNGNEYKFKIIQWFNATNSVATRNTALLTSINQYYFIVPDGDYQGAVVYFNKPPNISGNATIFYSFTNGECWAEMGNRTILLNGNININGDIPEGATQITGVTTTTIDYMFVVQNSASIIITRATPTLTINQTDKNYLNPVALSSTLATSIGYFQAIYNQAQGDAIRWIRWQVAQVNNGVVGEILVDTGDIYTPTLNFEYNGFFNGQQYALRCFGESESGQACDSGWQYFNIAIDNPGRYTGNIVAQCLNKENAALLEWEGVEIIPPTVRPDEYNPTISNGSVTLNANSSITWNKQGENPMNFSLPWVFVCCGRLFDTSTKNYMKLQFNFPYMSPNQTATQQQTIPISNKILGVFPDRSNIVEVLATYQNNTVTVTVKSFDRENPASVVNVFVECSPYLDGNITRLSLENQSVNVNFQGTTREFQITTPNSSFTQRIQDNAYSYILLISPTVCNIINVGDNAQIIQTNSTTTAQISAPITEIQINGGNNGAVFDSVSVYQGDGSNILSLYQTNPNFEPVWNDESYILYMTANFNGNLEGGTGTASGNGFRIYRQEVGTTLLTPIATVSSTTTSLKDYGIVSEKAYQYFLYAYDNNSAFMSAVEAENTIATNFKSYSLLVCDYDQDNDAYHVRKQYLFALNLADGSVSNNNSPTLNKNFTPYPTRMADTANYKSGTLSGLIGAIYTVPALIEQIGQYKYTAKPSTLDYFDSVDLEQELYDLSVAPYQLFLRDMKGRLRMIATSAPITMMTNIKQRQQSISISLSWVEVGDASDVTIIQTPDDYGWNNDKQVLDVQLDVDVTTGELYAQYPFPYKGTKFYLTGVNKEILTANTPLGVTPAQFELSDTAEQPDDGELTATVKANGEDNQ